MQLPFLSLPLILSLSILPATYALPQTIHTKAANPISANAHPSPWNAPAGQENGAAPHDERSFKHPPSPKTQTASVSTTLVRETWTPESNFKKNYLHSSPYFKDNAASETSREKYLPLDPYTHGSRPSHHRRRLEREYSFLRTGSNAPDRFHGNALSADTGQRYAKRGRKLELRVLPGEEASGAKLLDHSRSDAATKAPKSGPSSRAPLPKWPRPSSAPPRLQHEYEYSPPNTPSIEELESPYFEPPAHLDGGNTQGQHIAHSPSPVRQTANQPSAEKHGKRWRKRSLDIPDNTVDHILDPRGLGLLRKLFLEKKRPGKHRSARVAYPGSIRTGAVPTPAPRPGPPGPPLSIPNPNNSTGNRNQYSESDVNPLPEAYLPDAPLPQEIAKQGKQRHLNVRGDRVIHAFKSRGFIGERADSNDKGKERISQGHSDPGSSGVYTPPGTPYTPLSSLAGPLPTPDTSHAAGSPPEYMRHQRGRHAPVSVPGNPLSEQRHPNNNLAGSLPAADANHPADGSTEYLRHQRGRHAAVSIPGSPRPEQQHSNDAFHHEADTSGPSMPLAGHERLRHQPLSIPGNPPPEPQPQSNDTVYHEADMHDPPGPAGPFLGHQRGRHPPVSNPERSSSTPPHHTGQINNSLHPRADLNARLPRGLSGSSTAAVATPSPAHGGLVFTTSEEDPSTPHDDRRMTSGPAGSWRDEFPPPVGPDGRIHFGSFGDGGPSTPGYRSSPPGQEDGCSLTIPQTNAQAPPPLPPRPSPRPRLAVVPAVPRVSSRPVTSPRPSPPAQKRSDPASSAQNGQGITSHNRANEVTRERNSKNRKEKDDENNPKRKQEHKQQNSKRGKRRPVWSVKASAGAGGVNPYPRLSHRKGRKAMARRSAAPPQSPPPSPPPSPPAPVSPHKEEDAGINTHPAIHEQPHSPSKDYQFSPSQDQSSSSHDQPNPPTHSHPHPLRQNPYTSPPSLQPPSPREHGRQEGASLNSEVQRAGFPNQAKVLVPVPEVTVTPPSPEMRTQRDGKGEGRSG